MPARWRYTSRLVYRERAEDGGRWSDWHANTPEGLVTGWDAILRAFDDAGGEIVSVLAERADGNVHSMQGTAGGFIVTHYRLVVRLPAAD